MFAINILTGLLDSVLPAHCQLCGNSTQAILCNACDTHLPRITHSCEICALPLAHKPVSDDDFGVCGECLKVRPEFDKLIAPFVYKDEIAWMINKFKHRSRHHFGKFLSQHLQNELDDHLNINEKPDLVTSVPVHWTRLMMRGFNQAEVLARQVSKGIDIPYKSILCKNKRTAKQQGLHREDRLKNLSNVFYLKENIEGKFISVVDDVVTTGATAQILASLLVDAGARRVEIWALARTPKPE